MSTKDELRKAILDRGPGDYRIKFRGGCGFGMEVSPDPTDELPSGIPDASLVSVEEFRLPCFVGVRRRLNTVDPTFYETVESLTEDGPSLYDEVRIGVCRRIDLTVDLGNGELYQDRVEAIERLGPPIPIASLPEPLRSAQKRAQEKEKKG